MSQEAPPREVVREVDFEPAVTKAGILTTEFWTSVAVLASNVLLGLVMFGKLDRHDAQTLSDAIAAICTGLPLIFANVVVIWKYVSSRAGVKTAAIQETTRRMEMRENLRMQLRMGLQEPRVSLMSTAPGMIGNTGHPGDPGPPGISGGCCGRPK